MSVNSDEYHEEDYCFRIVQLNPKDAELLKQKFKDLSIEVKRWRKSEDFVVLLPITKGSNYEEFINFVKPYCQKAKSHGLYISLGTNSDNDGVSVPGYVIDFYKRLGGTIDFSFSFVNEGSEDI